MQQRKGKSQIMLTIVIKILSSRNSDDIMITSISRRTGLVRFQLAEKNFFDK
jgi:hypothetical protein